MTGNPWRFRARAPETHEQTKRRADELERYLVALAVHAPTIITLAEIGDAVSGRRQRGCLVAFQRKTEEARNWLRADAIRQIEGRRVAARREQSATQSGTPDENISLLKQAENGPEKPQQF